MRSSVLTILYLTQKMMLSKLKVRPEEQNRDLDMR